MFSRSAGVAARRVLASPCRPTALPAARQLTPATSVGSVRSYHEKVLDVRGSGRPRPGLSLTGVLQHYQNPRNVGSMDKQDQNVGTGLVRLYISGDTINRSIRG